MECIDFLNGAGARPSNLFLLSDLHDWVTQSFTVTTSSSSNLDSNVNVKVFFSGGLVFQLNQGEDPNNKNWGTHFISKNQNILFKVLQHQHRFVYMVNSH